ncbi:MAG: ACT domain-containing protein [Parvularcula sp.]
MSDRSTPSGTQTVGETDLHKLLSGLSPRLDPEIYVFATVPKGDPLPAAALMMFQEEEGQTLILPVAAAERLALRSIFRCQRITLDVHSSLGAVGLIAAVSKALAGAGIGTNPVAAYYHDHIFVPVDRAEEAVGLLRQLAKGL